LHSLSSLTDVKQKDIFIYRHILYKQVGKTLFNEKTYVPYIHVCMGRWDIVESLPTLLVIPLICAFYTTTMSNEDIKREIIEALKNGTLQPTTIVLGDNVQHQHKIEKVEAGGIGIQIVEAPSATPARPQEGDYNAVREYIELRKEKDPVFKEYCKCHNRKQICERLSDEFGWLVDAHHLGVNLNRNR